MTLPFTDPLILLSCCREARKSGNLQTAERLIGALSSYRGAGMMSSLQLKMARESAKLLYGNSGNQQSALLDMVGVACYSDLSGSGNNAAVSELVARYEIRSLFHYTLLPQMFDRLIVLRWLFLEQGYTM